MRSFHIQDKENSFNPEYGIGRYLRGSESRDLVLISAAALLGVYATGIALVSIV